MPFLPHVLMNFPFLSNFMIRALPVAVPPPLCPSATKMSPFGAIATSVGRSNSSRPGPATPGLPSDIKSFPSGLNFNTCWPFPGTAPLSATQTLPSLSTVILCGLQGATVPAVLPDTVPAETPAYRVHHLASGYPQPEQGHHRSPPADLANRPRCWSARGPFFHLQRIALRRRPE